MEASFNLGQFIFEQVVRHAQSHDVLKPIAYASLLSIIIEAQQPDILTATDEEALSPGFITINPKLQSLTGEDDPAIDPDASDSEAEVFQE
ncbi:hypothetical protein LIER_14387 [Lithospermum erythrorhizon]|uniref:Uncharacterized protein n=1 Tax=Lithospermum erythrorhizon TaxID=34254 RepID=A0AAV3Q1C4_LITER